MSSIFEGKTKTQETMLRVMFFVVGLYYLYLVIATVRSGEIRFRIPNHTVKPSDEPALFWLICAFYALVCVIGIIGSLKGRRNA